jgi:hypothetical protein
MARIVMRLLKASVAAAALAAAVPAYALGIGARVGTTGVGGDIGWQVAPTLSARLGYSGLSWNRNVSTDEVRYDGKLKLSNFSGLLDFSPLGPFRLTGGLIYNDNKYDLRGEPSGGSFRISGRTYSASDAGDFGGTVKSGRSLAPYLGVGYGNVAGLGVNFYADFGLIFQGSPRASLSATCGPALSAGACAQLQSDVAAEQARLEDKLKRFRYYPVLNLGITVGF